MKKIRNKTPTNSLLFSVVISFMVILSKLFSIFVQDAAHATEFSVNNVTELIEAINSANDEIKYPGPDTINMTKGTYTLIEVDNDTDGPNGLPSITSAITISGNESTIERSNIDETPEFRIFSVDSPGKLILNDLTISNGKNPGGVSGGGLYNKGILKLTTCNVIDNQAGDCGWGFDLYDCGGPGDGGGLYNEGILKLTTCNVIDNRAGDSSWHSGQGGDGGGLYNIGKVSMENSTFSGNQAGSGGSYKYGSRFSGGSGGGLYNHEGDVTINNSTFSANQAGTGGDSMTDGGSVGGDGGGVYNDGSVTINNSTFNNNKAGTGGGYGPSGGSGGSGGGLYNIGTVSMENSTFSGNQAGIGGSSEAAAGNGGDGGGLYNNAAMTISNSTFSVNQPGTGGKGCDWSEISCIPITGDDGFVGGIYNCKNQKLILSNSIVAQNLKGDCTGIVTSGDYNLDSDGSCNLTQPHDLPSTNPKLGRLADNGGSTLTHALLHDSPAIDTGNNEDCPETDQRGFSRRVDGDNDGKRICDIGSYEVQRCKGDFDKDSDVDGDDLAVQAGIGISVANDGNGISLAEFAENFGRINCPK